MNVCQFIALKIQFVCNVTDAEISSQQLILCRLVQPFEIFEISSDLEEIKFLQNIIKLNGALHLKMFPVNNATQSEQ